ncbi:HAMP domain-containing sensor histidine kinase [Chlorogloeopsis sp. ULAP01]|uniref:sensor histidine kinase n=1 Tax=Chlorogloeopsis sp. ULAP01 TaxID=3056483 RepID=UPI0025AAF49D|nr:HAMP domain-containing sensor histidine kinase [Chlorogloeopsis sp. ULAP01]MDM9380694.1 HAMP domain-containing sensor histidine kinase [Chlorogloeopsis sp. ULAP01]
MDWSNWIYLGAGLLLGMGVNGLLLRTKKSSSSLVLPVEQQNIAKLQEQLKQTQLAYHMAQEMSQFKAGFLARTTHVLRSPINGLIGLHQLILSNLCENPEEEREFIHQAQERALKLLKLIDEILNIARLEHGTSKLDLQSQSLAELLQEVYDLTYMLAENRNFPFKVLLPDPEIQIFIDFRWCRQALLYLIEAVIAQTEEGSIYISSQVASANNLVHIWLDVPFYAVSQSESIDLIKSEHLPSESNEENPKFLAGMNLLLAQVLLEVMGSKLEIIPFPDAQATTEDMIRLQLSIPLVTKGVEAQNY